MKYSFELRSRASQIQSIEQKHNQFVESLAKLPAPWGITMENMPPAPDPGGELVAAFNLGKLLGNAVREQVYYQFRRPFRDEAADDDFLDLTFDPGKIDFRVLAHEVFPQFVTAFDAYVGSIAHDEFSYIDYDAKRALRHDARHSVFRVYQVYFFDATLCKDAFNLSPEMVAEQLKGAVEHTRSHSNGVLVIGSSQPMNLADGDRLSREWRDLLRRD